MRKQVVGTLLLLVVVLVGTGCESKTGNSSEPLPGPQESEQTELEWTASSEYQIAVHFIEYTGKHTFTINGFPVERLPVMGRTSGQTVARNVTTGLVGEGNVASVRVVPYVEEAGNQVSVGPMRFEMWIQRDVGNQQLPGTKMTAAEVDSVYEAWVEQAREQWTDYRSRVEEGAIDSMRAWASRHPLTVSVRFDNEHGPDHSQVFEEAPRLEDTPATHRRLKDYALRLRDLMAQRDTLGLHQEAKLMFSDHDTGKVPPKEKILRIISTSWFSREWRLDFTAQEVGVRKWSEGRVWELYKSSTGKELFVAGKDREVGMLDIYVAEIDGELKVVR